MNIIVKKDKNFTYKFYEHNKLCKKRAESLFDKEAGTIEWIKKFNTNDVFFDIGASTGIYSIFAAPRVKQVICFEPHQGSFQALKENIKLNMWDSIEYYSNPLYHTTDYYDLRYSHINAGKGNNQLNSDIDDKGNKFSAAKTERVLAVSLDDFVIKNIGRSTYSQRDRKSRLSPTLYPTQIKIDVDGAEYNILKGAKELLKSGTVKSLIIEYNPKFGADTEQFMLNLGYKLEERQFTTNGKKLLRQGKKVADIAHNELYIRSTTS
jgi:FkbM family methyltransferase